MRKYIERTLTLSIINSKSLSKDFERIDNKPFTWYGNISENKALKEAKKLYGEATVISEIEVVEKKYKITVEKFIENAEIVE